MKQILMILAVITLLIMPGCVSTDRLTDTIFIQAADVESINAVEINAAEINSEIVNTDNAVIRYFSSENVTSGTLILTSLPGEDPGIPGAVWSDNGTLRISK